MAYARPFNQAQGASPWSAGVPPGLQQPQQAPAHQQPQQMFNQPMGAFDLSGAWQGQQQAGQWAPPMQPMQQPVQFVPNPAFMQQPQIQHQHQQHQQQRYQQNQQQRPMHQRSLSAPRVGANGPNRRGNQNNSFGGGSGGGGSGGGQWQQRQQHQQQNNNNNQQQQQQQQRATRQQSRQQKVQFSNNNNNNNNNNNTNTKQQNQQRQQQQLQKQKQQQQQNQQQQQQQAPKKGPVKVTKVVKKQILKAKQGVAKVKSADSSSTNDKATGAASNQQKLTPAAPNKPQSKTAERKQLKLQARKNAEGLKESKLPVVKSKKLASKDDGETPIDQAQLKCVPAVFGFVCKACDIFLRDRFARREHIDSEEHMQKFKVYEEELNKLKQNASEEKTTEASSATVASSATADDPKPSSEEEEEQKLEDAASGEGEAQAEVAAKEAENVESSA